MVSKSVSNLMANFSDIQIPMDVHEIMKYVPHRFPFLLVDRITHMDATSIAGYKNVTANEQFFQGHFPQKMVMPGVLVVEALAQVACVHNMIKTGSTDELGLLVGIDKGRFRSPVLPGDRLDLSAELISDHKRIGKCSTKALVGEKLVFSGELMFAMVKADSL